MTLYPDFGQRYHKPAVPAAVAAYTELAEQSGLQPAQMALAFLRSRPFVASIIVGATSLAQLRENLQLPELSPDLIRAIDDIHLRFSIPAP